MYTEVMKQNREFQLCYHKGKSFASKLVIVYARPNKLPVTRLGITTGKKVGNAVCRSRSRRLIRQAWRENELAALFSIDDGLHVRPECQGASVCPGTFG